MFLFIAEIKKLFVVVLAAKIFILGVFLFAFGEDRLLWADAPTYLDLGRNVALGNGFSQTSSDGVITPNTRFMPLYPTIIGLFSLIPHGLIFVSLLQAAAAAGIAVFVYKIGLFFIPHRWASGAALVAAFEPLISAIHILIMPETLFAFFLTGFLYFFLRHMEIWKSDAVGNLDVRFPSERAFFFFAIGMLIFAVYTKPAALYLVVFPVLFLIFARREWIRVIVFSFVFVLALAPWMARNAAVGGSFAITNDDVGNICGWTLHGVIATKYGVDPTDWSATWDKPEFLEGQKKCISSSAALRLFLAEHTAAFTKTMILSAFSLLTNDGYSVFFEKPEAEQIKPHHNFLTPAVFAMSDWRGKFASALSEFSMPELAIIFAGKLFWIMICIAAIVGIGVLLRDESYRVKTLFVTSVLLYFIAATIFVTAYGAGARLRYPISALLVILAAAGVRWFYGKVWIRQKNIVSPTIPNAGL